MQEIHCVPEIVSSLLCKVQLLFTYQGVYTHYYTLLNSLCALVCRQLQHKHSVINVDSQCNTLCLKMQNRMRI